jgi:hypothetical protein
MWRAPARSLDGRCAMQCAMQVEQLELFPDREIVLVEFREGRSLADLVRRAGSNRRLLLEAFGCSDGGEAA